MWWWFACSVQSTVSPPEPVPEPAEPPVDLSAAAFLDGCWIAAETTECWKSRGGPHLNGALTDSRPDASPSLQLMRLAERPSGLELHAHAVARPPGGAPLQPVALALEQAAPQHLVFGRGGEGYPTEAEYTLKDETLTVHYRGQIAGRPVTRTYAMQRDPVREGLERGRGSELDEAREPRHEPSVTPR